MRTRDKLIIMLKWSIESFNPDHLFLFFILSFILAIIGSIFSVPWLTIPLLLCFLGALVYTVYLIPKHIWLSLLKPTRDKWRSL